MIKRIFQIAHREYAETVKYKTFFAGPAVCAALLIGGIYVFHQSHDEGTAAEGSPFRPASR